MSKRLTEEAMAYFDECVSLSTFDSSDFSAPEDPPYSSVGATGPVDASSLVKGSPSTLFCYDQGSRLDQQQVPLFTEVWFNLFIQAYLIIHADLAC